MARPAKPKAQRRTLTIQVKVTAAQKAQLAKKADRAGEPLSTWMLNTALRAA